MLVDPLSTELNFPSYKALMLAAASGTAAGIALLLWIGDYFNRGEKGNKGNLMGKNP